MLKDGVAGVAREGDKIIAIKLVLGRDIIIVFSIYAPQIGLNESLKDKFCKDLDGLTKRIPQWEKIFIGGDWNGHLGRDNKTYEELHEGNGFEARDEEGKSWTLRWCMSFLWERRTFNHI